MGLNNAVQAAVLQCSFGLAPSTLMPLPKGAPVMIGGVLAGTTQDMAPVVNIPPFGMCTSLANPTVAAATSAALGVLTPMPCVPVTTGPWLPGAVRTLVNGAPALTAGDKCLCTWGGVISIVNPGAPTVTSG